MLLLLSFGFLIVLAVLLLSIWSTAYNVKHTIDPPEDASKGLTDKNNP